MATYGEVLNKIEALVGTGVENIKAVNDTRKDYIKDFQASRNRNLICYYSGWVQGGNGGELYSINDDDMNSFMAGVNGLDFTKGLDLVLHTPGGNVAATQALVTYLLKIFSNDIEVFVPHMAMSCGTMMACASKKIHMCKHSSLGPVDPQYSGIPIQEIIAEFDKGYSDIQTNSATTNYWNILLSKYPVAIYGKAKNTNTWAVSTVEGWLETVMFAGRTSAKQDAVSVVSKISSAQLTKTHDKHIMIDEAKTIGLIINDVESDQSLQDKLLGLHYSYVITFGNTTALKIVENHLGFDRVTMG